MAIKLLQSSSPTYETPKDNSDKLSLLKRNSLPIKNKNRVDINRASPSTSVHWDMKTPVDNPKIKQFLKKTLTALNEIDKKYLAEKNKIQTLKSICRLFELEHPNEEQLACKKVLATSIATIFEKKLENDKELKLQVNTLSTRIQTLASLFVMSSDKKQNQEQLKIISSFFKKDIEFLYDQGYTGEFNPDNRKKDDWFYQYSYYAYDKAGDQGKIVKAAENSRNYLDNSHPFYDLALIVNLHHGAHLLPIVGEDDYGNRQAPAPLATLLTADYTKFFVRECVIKARKYTENIKHCIQKEFFGIIQSPLEMDFASKYHLMLKDFDLKDFYQANGWLNAINHYIVNNNNAYVQHASTKDIVIAGASGTTIAVLCAHVRLLEFTHSMENTTSETININRNDLKRELLQLTIALYAWMGLAGDHSFSEVAFTHEFWDHFCDQYLNNEGVLAIPDQKEIDDLILKVESKPYATHFLEKVYNLYPDIFDHIEIEKMKLEDLI